MGSAIARLRGHPLGSRRVLLFAAAMHMVTETALAPFYPALFRAAFGVQDFAATGWFLALSRIAAVVALPLWGLAARRVRLHTLVLFGQSAAVLLTAGLALAPTFAVFTAIGTALVAAKSVVLLAYPRTAGAHPGGLTAGVRQYVAVLQAATVAAAVLGAAIVSVPDPMRALPLLVLAEAGLLIACVVAFRGPAPEASATAAHQSRSRPRPQLARLAAAVFLFALAGAVVRPFFTEFAASAGASEPMGALLFVTAHLAALVAVLRLRAAPGIAGPAALAAAGLLLQAVSSEPALIALGRVVFGAGLGLAQVGLDQRVLTAVGGSGYGLVAAAQHTGLLFAPAIAAGGARLDLAVPLLAGAGLFALLAAAVPALRSNHPKPTPPEVSDVPFPAVADGVPVRAR